VPLLKQKRLQEGQVLGRRVVSKVVLKYVEFKIPLGFPRIVKQRVRSASPGLRGEVWAN
jgi:hypothetical protein